MADHGSDGDECCECQEVPLPITERIGSQAVSSTGSSAMASIATEATEAGRAIRSASKGAKCRRDTPTAKGASTESVTSLAMTLAEKAKGCANTLATSSTASGTSTIASTDAATNSPMV